MRIAFLDNIDVVILRGPIQGDANFNQCASSVYLLVRLAGYHGFRSRVPWRWA